MLAGYGQLFLLEGEPGIGKTSLAETFTLDATASAARLLWAWCSDSPQAPPLWPWLQLVHGYLHPDRSAKARVQSQKRSTIQLGRAANEISALDELFRLPSDATQIDFLQFNSIATFFKDAARKRPLILVLDAFEAADNASLRMLRFLVGQLRECRIMVVAAYRMGAFRLSASSGVSGELISHGSWVPLRGLSEAEVGTLIEKLVGNPPDDWTVVAIHEASGGNPLMVNHLVRLHLADRAGQSIAQSAAALSWNGLRLVTENHIAPLSAPTRELLEVAAAIGSEFDLSALKRASCHSSREIFDALAEAESAGLVREFDGISEYRYRFTHGLVRDALCKEHNAGLAGIRELGGAQRNQSNESARCVDNDADGRPSALDAMASAREVHGPAPNGIDDRGSSNGSHAGDGPSPVPQIPAFRTNETDRNIFRREGEYWTLCLGHSLFRLRHSKGLVLIAHLLHHPNQEFHVLDLDAEVNGGSTRLGRRSSLTSDSHSLAAQAAWDGLGPLLDASAKASYRSRLRELAEDLAESKSLNDLGRIRRNEDEIDQLNRELARALGLNGRDRKAGSEIERSRIRITNAIRASLDKIGKNHPAMRRYLSSTIRTGAICNYTPDADFPGWQLE
jgi:AAA ATPase-like protein